MRICLRLQSNCPAEDGYCSQLQIGMLQDLLGFGQGLAHGPEYRIGYQPIEVVYLPVVPVAQRGVEYAGAFVCVCPRHGLGGLVLYRARHQDLCGVCQGHYFIKPAWAVECFDTLEDRMCPAVGNDFDIRAFRLVSVVAVIITAQDLGVE